MLRSRLKFGVCVLAISFAACGPKQKVDDYNAPAPALADSESRIITSDITGRIYQVTVALPRNYSDSDEPFRVLYLVDANGQFGTVVEAARLMRWEDIVPELIIVGVGYPVGRMWSAASPRSVDLTPTVNQDWIEWRNSQDPENTPWEGSGGAPGFLRFFTEELIPLIESEYNASESDRSLYGHSFGGLFGFYALLNASNVFHRFIIGSPSLWWDNRVSFELEATYAENQDTLEARVFFSVGSLESTEYRMVSNLEALIETITMRNYNGLYFEAVYFENETHNSVIPGTISRGLRMIYRDWNKPGA